MMAGQTDRIFPDIGKFVLSFFIPLVSMIDALVSMGLTCYFLR
jgi:hypothetical protein